MWFPEAVIKYDPAPDHLGLVVRPIMGPGSTPLLVDVVSGSLSLTSSGSGDPVRPATATVSEVVSSTGSTTFLSSDLTRRMATFFNDSRRVLYLKLGTGASTGSYTVRMPSRAYYELPYPSYTGIVSGVWSANDANGNVRITELTP